ncbi:MAG: c-type cytochrome [candidate division WOR-3 bacterium]
MKAIFILTFIIFSCNKQGRVLKYEEIKKLFKDRGCTNCHDIKRKLVGPSFLDIAKAYKNNKKAEEILLKSIKNGSCNKWGLDCMPKQELNPMEAKHMIKWIINLEE